VVLACRIIKPLAFVESQVSSTRQLTLLPPQCSPFVNHPSAATRPPTWAPIFLAPTTQSSSAPIVSNSISTSQSWPLLPLPPPLTTEWPESDNSYSKNKSSDQDEDDIQVLPGRKRKCQAKVQNKSSNQEQDVIEVLPRRKRKPSAKVMNNMSNHEDDNAIQLVPSIKRKQQLQVQ